MTIMMMKKIGPVYFIYDRRTTWTSLGIWGKSICGSLQPIIQFKGDVKDWYWRTKMQLNPFPVYHMRDETDCDHYRLVQAHKAKNGRAYVKVVERMYDGAEGPVSSWVISRKDYEEHTTQRRDYALEAFEDGHPHVIFR